MENYKGSMTTENSASSEVGCEGCNPCAETHVLRRVFAEIEIDETVASRNDKNYGPIDYLQKVIGETKGKGVDMTFAVVADEDDENPWSRYIVYLQNWIKENAENFDNENISPLSYEDWYWMYQEKSITKLIQDAGFGDLICQSFAEAGNNNRKKNLVIINDSDIYVTYKHNGLFGEFVCWVEDEFKENESVYVSMVEWVKDLYSREDSEIEDCLKKGNFPFHFTPY